jgi:hypothetical protein
MKPQLFIGSSREAVGILGALKTKLKSHFSVVPWTNGVFDLSSTTLEDLIEKLKTTDFAIFIFSPDDISYIRKKEHRVIRDNVLFELGLFTGYLGRKHTFILAPSSVPKNFHLASDLAGITYGTYEIDKKKKAIDVSKFCVKLKQQIFAEDKFPLSGKWTFKWGVRSSSYPRLNIYKESELFHYQDRVIGKCVDKRDDHIYMFRGEISGQYFTGTWRDSAGGPTYHGTFQVKIEPSYKELKGVWTGWSNKDGIKSGECTWKK